MSEQEERVAFEAGIKSINFPLTRKGEGYRSTYTDNMWLAYQAGRRDERAQADYLYDNNNELKLHIKDLHERFRNETLHLQKQLKIYLEHIISKKQTEPLVIKLEAGHFVPDALCKQGKCANATTGCIGSCQLDR